MYQTHVYEYGSTISVWHAHGGVRPAFGGVWKPQDGAWLEMVMIRISSRKDIFIPMNHFYNTITIIESRILSYSVTNIK